MTEPEILRLLSIAQITEAGALRLLVEAGEKETEAKARLVRYHSHLVDDRVILVTSPPNLP